MSIFARELSDDLASLVKQIDEQVAKNDEKKMAAFLVVLSEDADAAAPKLQEIAKAKNIDHVPLTIFDGEAGPPSYKIAQDADVTVLMWKGLEVKANHAFKKGELNAEKVQKVVSDTSKILE
ncbi:MAG: hypothetical protein KY475_24720 [Planctomycetes bacterium]|nr:hypothetical protein [Planctomycetota bacterium]